MKLTIVHDSKGNILDLVAYPSDAPPAYPRNSGGLVSQIEVPDLTVELGGKKIIERLNDIRANSRVELADGGRARLTLKRN
jgi:hypothetical protein